MRYVMVLDLSRCIGCQACTVACKQKNGTPPDVLYSQVLVEETGTFPNSRMTFLPILCMHCDNPPCESVCPTGATEIHENGIVTVDAEKCIGCRYCMAACPYNARFFNYGPLQSSYEGQELSAFEQAHQGDHPVGVVGKCDFCIDRVNNGEVPACVQACPAVARYFGDLDDPDSEVSKLIASRGGYTLFPELGTEPSVYYLPG